jgi:hypothetical protein
MRRFHNARGGVDYGPRLGLDYQKQMRLQFGHRALVNTGTHAESLIQQLGFCLESD